MIDILEEIRKDTEYIKIVSNNVSVIANSPMEYNSLFIQIRSQMENKYNRCYVCNKRFNLNEDMYILFTKQGLNEIACTKCCDKLKYIRGENNDRYSR